jgi:hypothetical protein
MHVIVGDTTVYGAASNHLGQTLPPPAAPGCYNNQQSVHDLAAGAAVIPGPAGATCEVISIHAHLAVTLNGGAVLNVEMCLYDQLVGAPNAIVANSYAARAYNADAAAAWVALTYPSPRPLLVAGQAYYFGLNAIGGVALSSIDLSYNAGIPTMAWDKTNNPAGAGIFLDPWVAAGGGIASFSAYIVIDVPPVLSGLAPNEKNYRLRGRRGGWR